LSYNGGQLVAADTRILPFHTTVRIPGYAGRRPVPVVDRGSAVKGRMIDVFFWSHSRAKRWGKKRLLVEIAP
jgi:3D (Asp-Asp-Asp) domain-containing protein